MIEDGVYIVKDGVLYKITPKIQMPFSKRVNVMTGEVYYPSNADRIRAMSDEELAEWMAINTDCLFCKVKDKNICSLDEGTCAEEWRFWLKSPVEVDNG